MKYSILKTVFGFVFTLLLLFQQGILHAAQPDNKESQQLRELGERIYHQGVLTDGSSLAGVVPNSPPDGNVACVRCHRRSALGGMEGGELVPPVTGDYLFRNQLKVVTKPVVRRIKRWAYNQASLDRVLSRGIDVMGQPLTQSMPRYHLNDSDLKALMAYLQSLDSSVSQGVEEKQIHFATIVHKDLPEKKRKALIETAKRYAESENRAIQGKEKRAQFSDRQNNWNSKSFRRWNWHLWEISGEPQSWQAQLEDYYRQQPVFLIVGGAVKGPWQRVEKFCESTQIPCLFPHTELPQPDVKNYYTFHYSEGLYLEARVLGSYLKHELPDSKQLVQVYRDDRDGGFIAQHVRNLMQSIGVDVTDIGIPAGDEITEVQLQKLQERVKDSALMLWLDEGDLKQFTEHAQFVEGENSFLSSSLLSESPVLSGTVWDDHLRVIHPFTLPWEPSGGIGKSFLIKEKLGNDQFRLRSETFAAFAAVSQVLKRVKHNLVRDYFMEQLEHMSEDLRETSLYPRFSLGPYQRYVSKGAYVFPLNALDPEKRARNYRWVIPAI